MSELLEEWEFYDRESRQNYVFKYLNASQRLDSYLKYVEAHKLAEANRKAAAHKQLEESLEANRQEEQKRRESAYKERLRKERLEEQKRQAEEHAKRQIESLGPLQSAQIARKVTSRFDANEILEVIDFFESPAQVYESVLECHAKLEPEYRREIIAWLLENTDLRANQLEGSTSVDKIVSRCMNQGLSAVLKTDPLNHHLGDHKPYSEVGQHTQELSAGRIEKSRSWKEISADGD